MRTQAGGMGVDVGWVEPKAKPSRLGFAALNPAYGNCGMETA
jgi:hypothetical protein